MDSPFEMYCDACDAFEPDVRLVGGGIKTCVCGVKRWKSRPPASQPEKQPPHAEPKPWDLTTPDRMMLLHFGIDREET